MPDRSPRPQARRTDAADPARARPQGAPPPLAALQARAGNRAVTAAIQRAALATRPASSAEERRQEDTVEPAGPVSGRPRSNSAPAALPTAGEGELRQRRRGVARDAAAEGERRAAYREVRRGVAQDAAAKGELQQRRRGVARDAAAEGERRAAYREVRRGVAQDAAAKGELRQLRQGVARDAAAKGELRQRRQDVGREAAAKGELRQRRQDVGREAAAEGARRLEIAEQQPQEEVAVEEQAVTRTVPQEEVAVEEQAVTRTVPQEEAAVEEQAVTRTVPQEEAAVEEQAVTQEETAPLDLTTSQERRPVEQQPEQQQPEQQQPEQQPEQQQPEQQQPEQQPEQQQPEQQQPEQQQPEQQQTGRKKAKALLDRCGAKVKSFATKAKQILDPPDTGATRINAPLEGGFRNHAQNTANTGLSETTADMAQAGSALNTTVDGLAFGLDLSAMAAALKEDRKTPGPASHKPSKDLKGKSASAAQNAGMLTGDIGNVANAAVRNGGTLGGVPALADVTGGATIFYSTMIVAREGPAVVRAVGRVRQLKNLLLRVDPGKNPDDPDVKRPFQELLDDLNRVGDALDDARAQREQATAGANGSAVSDELTASIAALERELAGLSDELRRVLADTIKYARRKQKFKTFKRLTNFTGNGVRTAGGALAIAGVAGAISGPAAPAVAGAAAGVLLSLALWKGVRAGRNRYVDARHPERYARPTPAQAEPESETESESGTVTNAVEGETSATQTEASPAAPAGGLEAVGAFLNVTRSVSQGKRQFYAQQLYALAAGRGVAMSRHMPADIRESARELLKIIKAGPQQHKHESEEAWAATLDDPLQQAAWEKEITNQLASS